MHEENLKNCSTEWEFGIARPVTTDVLSRIIWVLLMFSVGVILGRMLT